MSWLRQDTLGRCDFLDVLEEAAVRRTPVELELSDGQRFSARVVDVEATAQGDVVVLDDGRRIPVGEVGAMTRAER